MTTRAYVPATRTRLADWHAAGAVPADAERVLAHADDENSEYDALMTAAEMAAALGPEDGRRVVVVAETEEAVAEGSLPLRRWVAVHCDVADRPADADPDDDLAWFATQEIPDLL
ncbi:MAG: hypothetical protein WKF50_11500 [Nocardioides sp.]